MTTRLADLKNLLKSLSSAGRTSSSVLDDIKYFILDSPVFRAQTKAEPYSARVDDLSSAIFYSTWNQASAATVRPRVGVCLRKSRGRKGDFLMANDSASRRLDIKGIETALRTTCLANSRKTCILSDKGYGQAKRPVGNIQFLSSCLSSIHQVSSVMQVIFIGERNCKLPVRRSSIRRTQTGLQHCTLPRSKLHNGLQNWKS